MKQRHIFSLAVAAFWGAVSLGAHGTHFMALSAAAGGMGGVSTGTFIAPSDAMIRNSANLGLAKMGVGTWIFELDTHLGANNVSAIPTAGGTEVNSTAGVRLIPELAAVYRPIERVTLGIGILPYGGGASDFSAQATMVRISAESRLIRVPLAIAFEPVSSLHLAFTPFLNYGELVANHSHNLGAPTSASTTRMPHGSASVGFQFGASYGDPDHFTFGGSYTSKFTHNYASVLDFEAFNGAPSNLDDLAVEEPDVFAVGVAGKPTENLKLALDFRVVRWGSSNLYHQLGWDNVPVIAIGGEYSFGPQWKARLGGAWGKSPQTSPAFITTTGANSITIQGHTVLPSSLALLNAFALPSTGQTHLSIGGSYAVTEALTLDLAGVLVFANQLVHTGFNNLTGLSYSYTTNQSQWSLAVGGTMRL